MTLFEYLSVGYSLIVSFAVLRALSGFPHILRTSNRYWVHVFWVSFGLFGCLVIFWGFWRFREAEWTLFRYILLLAIPALMYVQNSILVPSDPGAVTCWRDYFFEVRTPLFATGLLLHTATITANHVLLGVPLLGLAVLPLYGVLGLCAVGLFSKQPNVHAVLALGLFLFSAVVLSVMAQPGL